MIERIQDYRRIKRLTKEKLIVSSEAFYLIATASGVDCGVIAFYPHEWGLIMHVEFKLGKRGRFASNAYLEAMSWIFDNTTVETLIGEIPQDNRPAHLMARKVGASFNGTKDGLRLYSIRKEDFQLEVA